jgi:type I restriction-modification system DNA methylase subunit
VPTLTSKVLIDLFGRESSLYKQILNELEFSWKKIESLNKTSQFNQAWTTDIKSSYGRISDLNFVIINHTYLLLTTNFIIKNYLDSLLVKKRIANQSIDIINDYFDLQAISYLSFCNWIFEKSIKSNFVIISNLLNNALAKFELSATNNDIFRNFYENILTKPERHKSGEYYTPDWLSEYITNEVWNLWSSDPITFPKVLDPACGAGTFLIHWIKLFLRHKPNLNIKDIIRHIHGFDINPIALYIARANYLLILNPEDLNRHITIEKSLIIPIFLRDSLKDQSLIDHLQNNSTFHEKYDILIGNPPWIVMRSIKNKEYQNFLKNEVFKYKLLEKKDVHLFTQIEIASLFFCKTANNFLTKNGLLAFIMPKSVLSGTNHQENFRYFKKPRMKLLRIQDLHQINSLFGMPSCILYARKGKITKYPVDLEVFIGESPHLMKSMEEVKQLLTITRKQYDPPKVSTEKSWYYDKFKVGASIFPRNFYFIERKQKNSKVSFVETSSLITRQAKPEWKSIYLKGYIENQFIFQTLLSWKMVNFGFKSMQNVVLPAIINRSLTKTFIQPVAINELEKYGAGIAKWFIKANNTWKERQTEKSKSRFPSLIERLNYNGLLQIQNPNKKFVVLYSATGTNITSCIIERNQVLNSFPNNFIADVKTWFYETNNELEAHYLCALFNSEILNQLIKPLQPQGLGGGRAIHRRPLLFPIPQFDENISLHKELAHISKKAHKKIAKFHFNKPGNIRRQAKEYITSLLDELKILSAELLKIP